MRHDVQHRGNGCEWPGCLVQEKPRNWAQKSRLWALQKTRVVAKTKYSFTASKPFFTPAGSPTRWGARPCRTSCGRARGEGCHGCSRCCCPRRRTKSTGTAYRTFCRWTAAPCGGTTAARSSFPTASRPGASPRLTVLGCSQAQVLVAIETAARKTMNQHLPPERVLWAAAPHLRTATILRLLLLWSVMLAVPVVLLVELVGDIGDTGIDGGWVALAWAIVSVFIFVPK
eukprot:scaffold14366_cov94-Isochrysis_galbana.AAC.3